MSDILIRGMEMPKTKLAGMVAVYNAYIVVKLNGDVKIVVDNEDKTDSTDYKLIEVPPHGKLGDFDALCKTLRSLAENEYTPEVFANWIENHIDTIIPADDKDINVHNKEEGE